MKMLTTSLASVLLLVGVQLTPVYRLHAQTQKAAKPKVVRITDGPRVEGVGDTWAVIAWTTSTGGSTIVRYGTDRHDLSRTAEAPYSDNDKTQAQNHRVHIQNLKPNTTYYFMADSGQGEGTGAEAKSPVSQFTTKGAGSGASAGAANSGKPARAAAVKIVDGPRVEGTGKDWATIAWTTNTGGSSVVHYGTDRNRLVETAESPYADVESKEHQTHRVRVTRLRPNTTYYFVADSGQGEGTGTEAKSKVEEFKTK